MKKMHLWALSSILLFGCSNEKTSEAKSGSAPAATETPMAPAEFADPKYAEMGKKALEAMSAGDVSGFVSNYADNAVYQFNSGDSITGKAAIETYWKQRRTEVMDSITFTNAIFLPIKVNQPQSVEQPGVWLLSWYQVNAKYKSGKKMSQWIHTDIHFNESDQVDRVIQYLDRVPINAAMSK